MARQHPRVMPRQYPRVMPHHHSFHIRGSVFNSFQGSSIVDGPMVRGRLKLQGVPFTNEDHRRPTVDGQVNWFGFVRKSVINKLGLW
jgi:hypothetical protein